MTETADTIFLFTPCVNGLQVDLNGGVYPSSSGASATNLVWDWGDGQQTSAPFVISHTYSSAGQYTIQVTAYYSDGTTASTLQTANVGPGVLSNCESLTITAEQGGSVSYQASVGSGAVSQDGSITLQLAYADDLSLTATPCSRNFFSDWSASSGITGLGGAPVPQFYFNNDCGHRRFADNRVLLVALRCGIGCELVRVRGGDARRKRHIPI